ncbi:hypothetical protein AAFC00_002537 [Neodothiora populina]|uniref:UDP-N-acetylglucosamine transferase subunit ALG14 n=1 Tax=Neodothiora populina TaxID=2781224 RepID=A0ABR3P7F1_9PEZI
MPSLKLLATVLLLLLLILSALLATSLRLLYILRPRAPTPKTRGCTTTHLLVVLGSGGHTAEMIEMLRVAVLGRERCRRRLWAAADADAEKEHGVGVMEEEEKRLLDWRDYTHRTWVVSSGDAVSASRAKEVEDEFAAFYSASLSSLPGGAKAKTGTGTGTYDIHTVPRARKIHQSLLSTPLSSLACLWACLSILCFPPSPPSPPPSSSSSTAQTQTQQPDLILTNGPATGTILCFAALLARLLNVRGADTRNKLRVVYVESFARVKRMSLSGRILGSWGLGVRRVVVQWEGLCDGASPVHVDGDGGSSRGDGGEAERKGTGMDAGAGRRPQQQQRKGKRKGKGKGKAEFLGVLV